MNIAETLKILTSAENLAMQFEIFIMLLLLFAGAFLIKKGRSLRMFWGAEITVFLYLHRIILPFIVSGLYIAFVAGVISVLYGRNIKKFKVPVMVFLEKLKYCTPDDGERKICRIPAAVIICILLIQLCRINIAIDYDSLRYGLRSDVLLGFSGGVKGFFENTGLVNNVYVYPKAFELLTLPLYISGSFGFVLCVNVWLLILVMLAGGAVVYELTRSREAGVCAAFFISLIPGITNMSLTAKTDMVTLLVQTGFILCAVKYVKSNAIPEKKVYNGEDIFCGAGIALLIISISFKPTAPLFSGGAGIALLIWMRLHKVPVHFGKKDVFCVLLSSVFSGFFMLRTYIITGVPLMSSFAGIFEKAGMKLKYPFASPAAVSSGNAEPYAMLKKLLMRVFGVFVYPGGEEFSHVFMAWSGPLVLVMIVFLLFMSRKMLAGMKERALLAEIKGEKEKAGEAERQAFLALLAVMAGTAFISLLILALVYQIDGNYFMFLYVQIAVSGTVFLAQEEQAEQKSHAGAALMSFMTAACIFITAFTGWAGPVGFTPAMLINKGWYDHSKLLPRENPLGFPEDTRIVAFAPEPECYFIPARVESAVDIGGSGGNVYLYKKLNIFKEYLSFAKIDYIYCDKEWLDAAPEKSRERLKELFYDMLDDCEFESVEFTGSSGKGLYCKIDKERMSVGWEIEPEEEKLQRTQRQKEALGKIG